MVLDASVALAMTGGMLLNVLLKHAYERARPSFDDPILTLETYSFPSGHTAGATVFYGVLAAFLVSRTSRHRWRAAMVAVAVAADRACGVLAHLPRGALPERRPRRSCSSTAWLALCLSVVHQLVKTRMLARFERIKAGNTGTTGSTGP